MLQQLAISCTDEGIEGGVETGDGIQTVTGLTGFTDAPSNERLAQVPSTRGVFPNLIQWTKNIYETDLSPIALTNTKIWKY